VPPELDGQLVINEVMVANVYTARDERDLPGDWIELYNPTDQELSLHGYGITDDLTDPLKHTFPDGVEIPAGGHLLVWADDSASQGGTHTSFRLSREMGELGLARPDGTWIDRVQYAEQAVDFSAAREPDGSDRWVIEWHASPEAANPTGPGAPVGLEDETAPPEQIPATGDLTEQLLGYDAIPEIAFVVSPAGVESLENDPRTYVEAQLIFRGRTYGPVGLRLKGGNSFQELSAKPSFRINVDHYNQDAEFWGMKDLTLNNMDDDLSMLHERLSYRAAREVGIPASRCNHALLTFNGVFYGLYANVETVKRRMVARWFEDSEGPLFEATDVDFMPQYIDDYEHEAGPDDRSLLEGAAAALAQTPSSAAIAAVAQYVDLPAFQRFWAFTSVIGQFDSFPYSNPGDDYFVYADPTTNRLRFMPWGMDETFYDGSRDVTVVISILARKCAEVPSCFDGYVAQVWDVLGEVEALDLDAERQRVAAQIRPLVHLDTRKPYTNEQVASWQANIFWFLSERRAHLEEMLPP
jgi:hypothetical protein